MQDGCKEGRSDQYWFQAEREFHSKDDQAADLSQTRPQPSSHTPCAPKRSTAGAKTKAGQTSPIRTRAAQTTQQLPG
jgi:hypothetical protein